MKEPDLTETLPDEVQDISNVGRVIPGETIDLPSDKTSNEPSDLTQKHIELLNKISNEELMTNKDNDALSGNQDRTTTLLPDTDSNEPLKKPDSNVTLPEVSQTAPPI
jgi:hypothetical protein